MRYNYASMSDERYKKSTGAVFTLKYHIVFCPKYRREILSGKVADDLKKLLYQKAKEQDWQIEALEIMPDHVHLFLSADPTDAPCRIVNQLKGFTSHELRKRHTWLKSRLPSLWSRSYYIGSVGHVSEKTVNAYIENQKGK
jgi:putative transposase